MELMYKWIDNLKLLSAELSKLFNKSISEQDIIGALFMILANKKDLDVVLDIWNENIEYEEAFELLRNFDFELFSKTIETEKSISEDILIFEKKQTFKISGAIWRIHKNDADHFPSIPHLHELTQNIKLDITNGKCYRKKQLIKTFSRKYLLEIRKQVAERYKNELPPLGSEI